MVLYCAETFIDWIFLQTHEHHYCSSAGISIALALTIMCYPHTVYLYITSPFIGSIVVGNLAWSSLYSKKLQHKTHLISLTVATGFIFPPQTVLETLRIAFYWPAFSFLWLFIQSLSVTEQLSNQTETKSMTQSPMVFTHDSIFCVVVLSYFWFSAKPQLITIKLPYFVLFIQFPPK